MRPRASQVTAKVKPGGMVIENQNSEIEEGVEGREEIGTEN